MDDPPPVSAPRSSPPALASLSPPSPVYSLDILSLTRTTTLVVIDTAYRDRPTWVVERVEMMAGTVARKFRHAC